MHPLIYDLGKFKDAELESKIAELGKKYFMTQNFELQHQITTALDTYMAELTERRAIEWEKMLNNKEKGFDKLINVN
jgi:hypothetical protein